MGDDLHGVGRTMERLAQICRSLVRGLGVEQGGWPGVRFSARVALDWIGATPLTRQSFGLSDHAVATATAAYARKPRHLPSG